MPAPTLAGVTSSQAELQVATARPAEHLSPVEAAASSPAAPVPLPVQRSLRVPEPVTGSSPRGLLENLAGSGTIRRRVKSFTVNESEKLNVPSTELITNLKRDAAGQFTQKDDDVHEAIKQKLSNHLVRPIETPREVTVTVNGAEPKEHPKRRQQQTNVGQIGGDEFFIRTGLRESFEGGHLVGHQFWDVGDSPVDKAGDYGNLLPMSRTLNVNAFDGWKKTETKLAGKIQDLQSRKKKQDGSLRIEVENEFDEYDVTLKDICKRFGVNLKKTVDPAKKIAMHRWLPGSIKSSWENLDTGSDSEWSPVKETGLRSFEGFIDTKEELVTALQEGPLWERLTPKMKATLS